MNTDETDSKQSLIKMNADNGNDQNALPVVEPDWFKFRRRGSLLSLLAFFLGEFQGDFDIAAAIEAGNGADGGSHIVVLGVDLVIHVGVEAAETIITRLIRDIGFYRLGFHIFQVNHAGRHGIFAFINHAAMHDL